MTKLPDEQGRGAPQQGPQQGAGDPHEMPGAVRGSGPQAAALSAAPAAWRDVEHAKLRAKCLELALLRPRAAEGGVRPMEIAQRFWDWVSNPQVQAIDVDPLARQQALRAAAQKAAQTNHVGGKVGGQEAVDHSHLNRD